MSAAQEFADLYRMPPREAVAYMAGRSWVVPSFNWQDIWQEEHASQFTVSRLTSADLLQTFHDLVTRSVAGDLTRTDFLRDARAALSDAGWWGENEVLDPSTGELLRTRFDASRLKLIFDVNTRMAGAAGQWERVQRTKASHPYLRYITKRDGRVRELHRRWDRLTLPVDDAFWEAHLPPNGWRCRCRVVAVTQREFDRGTTPTGEPMIKVAPPQVDRAWENPRTGEVLRVPSGVDPGFAYNPGKARAEALSKLVLEKLVALNASTGAAAWRAVRGHAEASFLDAWKRTVERAAKSFKPTGAAGLVHVLDDQVIEALRRRGLEPASAAVLMRDTELVHALRDAKANRDAALSSEVLEDLPALLLKARPMLDVQDEALVWALDLPGRPGKVVVRLNYREKIRLGTQRAKVLANLVQTAGLVDPGNLVESRYVGLLGDG